MKQFPARSLYQQSLHLAVAGYDASGNRLLQGFANQPRLLLRRADFVKTLRYESVRQGLPDAVGNVLRNFDNKSFPEHLPESVFRNQVRKGFNRFSIK